MSEAIRFYKFLYKFRSEYKKTKNKEKVIFLLGTPLHGNIGDQAITIAEYKFLKAYFKDYKVIEIPSIYLQYKILPFKKIIDKSLILIHGGGFIGSLWPAEEKMFQNVLKEFKNNSIIILPQTIFYENNELGMKFLEEDKKIMSEVSDLTLVVREEKSYELAKKSFSDINVFLCPDMVCFLKGKQETIDTRNNVLVCKRADKENTINDNDFNVFINEIKEKHGKVDFTDTVISREVSFEEREDIVEDKIRQFMNYELIITDRLHGMVLAAISNTPCIALGNCNYKISGVYHWIKNNDSIKFVNSLEEALDNVEKLKNTKNFVYDNGHLNCYFDILADMIAKKMGD